MKLDDVVRKRIDRLNSLLAGLGRAEKVVFSTEDMVKCQSHLMGYESHFLGARTLIAAVGEPKFVQVTGT